jgi:hypothetical protein
MWKTLLLLVAGLGAGFAIALWTQPGDSLPAAETATSASAAPDGGGTARLDAAASSRLEDLESALQTEIEQRAALEQRVTDLGAELDALRAPRQARAANNGPGGQPAFDPSRLPPAAQEFRRAR